MLRFVVVLTLFLMLLPYSYHLRIPISPIPTPFTNENQFNYTFPLSTLYNFSRPSLSIYIGTPPQQLQIGISTIRSISWISSTENANNFGFQFDSSRSSSYWDLRNSSYSLQYQSQIIIASNALDYFSLSKPRQSDSRKYSFGWFESIKNQNNFMYNPWGGELSFYNYHSIHCDIYAPVSEHNKDSFINNWLMNKYIQSDKVYALDYNTRDGGAIIFDEKYNKTDYLYCDSEDGFCTINQIHFGDNKLRYFYSISSKVLFDVNEEYIVIPESKAGTVFNAYHELTWQRCFADRNNEDVEYLICKQIDIGDIPDMLIEFNNNIKLRFRAKDFFIKNKDGDYVSLFINRWKGGMESGDEGRRCIISTLFGMIGD